MVALECPKEVVGWGVGEDWGIKKADAGCTRLFSLSIAEV